MNNQFLANTLLFHGIREDEIKALLPCLEPREAHYGKEAIIYRAGDTVSSIGLVLKGSVNVIVNFFWGNCNIFGHVGCGEIFAETYAILPGRELICDVVAAEDCDILFLNMNKLLTSCGSCCAFHRRLIHNMVRISAEKNLGLSSRMMHIAPKSIRERLLSYLSEQALTSGRANFSIPFSRQQLADYLGVDRSALSNELSKMQKDGLLSYRKNTFTLNSDF